MAAKQGLSAHFSQASEDAKRAVLSRAPSAIKSHSWLHNLNTTCTIKSAPPRTPEVMTLLSVRSGWLVKRNEQHVWQRRWCCVVPHMMLYYFEAEPELEQGDENEFETKEGFSGGGIYRSDATIVENQDILNAAVRDGYHHRRGSSTGNLLSPNKGRDGDYISYSVSPNATDRKMLAAPVRGPRASSSNLSPAGIIDLECYTSVNRSSVHDCVFELTGDSVTNPDLRSFYFQAADVEDCELWTNALLSDRHSALKDEREAYRQVCESFQLQLQNMSDMIDAAEGRTADAEKKLYNVRSKSQQFKTQVTDIVKEILEEKTWNPAFESEKNLENARLDYLEQLSMEQSQLLKNNDLSPIQMLADYLHNIISSHNDLNADLLSTQQKLSRSANDDSATVSEMKAKLERLEAERQDEKARYEGRIAGLEAKLHESEVAREDLENQLQTKNMDFTMLQSHAKSKCKKLASEKKILKKEVINLRQKMELIETERDAVQHLTDSHKLKAMSAIEKNEMLEKYIEKMENQVRVQQNMMEMISLSGMSQSGMSQGGDSQANGSVVGRIIAAGDDQSFSSFGNFRVRDASPIRVPKSRKPLLPKGPPISTIRKVDNDETSSPMSPPNSPTRTRPVRKFGADSFDTDDEGFQKQSQRNGSGGILDQEIASSEPEAEIQPPPNLSRELDIEEDSESRKMNKEEVAVARFQTTFDNTKSPTVNLDNFENNDSFQRETPKISNGLDQIEQDDEDDSMQGDDKTNVSELTEDRTQRHLDAIHFSANNDVSMDRGTSYVNPSSKKPSEQKKEIPPRYIMGLNSSGEDRNRPDDTNSISKAIEEEDASDKMSTTSGSIGTKLSVAQRARIAAQKSNTVKVRRGREPRADTPDRRTPMRSQSPGGKVFSRLSQKFVNAVDNSIIGVKTPADVAGTSDDTASVPQAPASPANTEETTLTLVERQKLQRERQLKVLREQGILKEGSEHQMRGGGGSPLRPARRPTQY